MSEYKEVNPFTGKEIDEDAPANVTGPSVAGTGDDNTVHTMRKKKKKTLYDGRTKVAKKFIERIMKQREARKVAEEVELDEAKSQGMFIVLEKGSKNKVIGQFKRKEQAISMMKKNAGSKIIQIGKFATDDGKPVDIKVGDNLSYTRVKLATKIKEEVELDEVLKPKDKKVIDDFVQMNKGTGAQNFTQRGNIVDYEGRSLEKRGMGAQQIATVSSSGVKIHAKMDSRSTQSIVNYLKKSAKKYSVKVEETDLEEMPYYRKIYDKIHQMIHPKGYEKIMKMYVDLHKQGHRNPAQAVGQQVRGVEARDVAYYINGLIKKGKLPSALAAEVEPKKFTQKVKEQIENFGKEYELVENNLKILQNIVKKKQNQNVRLDNKNVKVDLYTASAIMNVYNAVSKDNKKKMERMMNGNLNQFLKLQGAAFKLNKG
tara:strand:+ start:788 stop:2071 length:1284 start_codon:yes stop_codon:yes gene_type:complete